MVKFSCFRADVCTCVVFLLLSLFHAAVACLPTWALGARLVPPSGLRCACHPSRGGDFTALPWLCFLPSLHASFTSAALTLLCGALFIGLLPGLFPVCTVPYLPEIQVSLISDCCVVRQFSSEILLA